MEEKSFDKKEISLLTDFESAYSALWEEYCAIKEYADKNYEDGIRQFIDDVRHSCDYFSLSKPMIAFCDEFKNEGRGTKEPARGAFSENKSEQSQNYPLEEK